MTVYEMYHSVDPVNLVLDRANSLVLVEQTHLVSFGFVYEQV
jgi:hypothetical protein